MLCVELGAWEVLVGSFLVLDSTTAVELEDVELPVGL